MCLIKGLQVIAALVVHSSNTLFWFTRRIYLFFYFCLVRPALMAYGGSQARVWIGAAAACLHHSSQKCWILNPLSEARDRTWVLMDTSRVHYCWATIGTPHKEFWYVLRYAATHSSRDPESGPERFASSFSEHWFFSTARGQGWARANRSLLIIYTGQSGRAMC